MEKFSVIIRAKNEEQWIGHCIQSILDNFKQPEIIILNNNSKDKTLEICRSFMQDRTLKNTRMNAYSDIKIFNIDDYTPGKSLNLGVKNSSFENIMIISAHCVITKINIADLKNNLKKFVCIFGNQDPVFYGKKISKRYIWSHFKDKKVKNMYSSLEKRYFLHNALAVYKKSFLLKNKFDENLSGKEDRYMAELIMKNKKNYLYDPSFKAFHHYTEAGKTWIGVA